MSELKDIKIIVHHTNYWKVLCALLLRSPDILCLVIVNVEDAPLGNPPIEYRMRFLAFDN